MNDMTIYTLAEKIRAEIPHLKEWGTQDLSERSVLAYLDAIQLIANPDLFTEDEIARKEAEKSAAESND